MRRERPQDGQCLNFVKVKVNVYYLKARITQETVIANYTLEKDIETAIVSDSDLDDKSIPDLITRAEDVEESQAKKKSVQFKDNTKMTEKEELKPYSINEAHHKWGHHGEERLRKMAETKGFLWNCKSESETDS